MSAQDARRIAYRIWLRREFGASGVDSHQEEGVSMSQANEWCGRGISSQKQESSKQSGTQLMEKARRRRRLAQACMAVVAASAAAPSSPSSMSFGATKAWNPAFGSGNWSVAGSWSPTGAPANGDT